MRRRASPTPRLVGARLRRTERPAGSDRLCKGGRRTSQFAFGLTFALALALALARISSLRSPSPSRRAMVSGDTAVKEARMRPGRTRWPGTPRQAGKDPRGARASQEHYAIKEPLPRRHRQALPPRLRRVPHDLLQSWIDARPAAARPRRTPRRPSRQRTPPQAATGGAAQQSPTRTPPRTMTRSAADARRRPLLRP